MNTSFSNQKPSYPTSLFMTIYYHPNKKEINQTLYSIISKLNDQGINTDITKDGIFFSDNYGNIIQIFHKITLKIQNQIYSFDSDNVFTNITNALNKLKSIL